MATCSSILAWESPWTEEPGRLQRGGKESDMTDSVHTQSPGEGNGNPLQYCCLANPTDRGV